MDVKGVNQSIQQFSGVDYAVFVVMLVICMGIGVYFAWEDHQNKKKRPAPRRGSVELTYLVGNRQMKVFPVAMSLVASLISGIALLGTSTEVYLFGIDYAWIFVGIILCGVCLHFVFLPLYMELRLTSMYEYLERRFDKKVRLIGSVLFILKTTINIPIIIYVPALAFNQVTGVSIGTTTIVVGLITIFYTTIGGLKAVVWTDVIQGIVMFGALIAVAVKATYDVGGLGVVIDRNKYGERLQWPSFDLDPTLRNSFWTLVFGGFFLHTGFSGSDQSMIQRYASLPSLTAARQALWLFVLGMILVKGCAVYNGLLLYATYYDCDPLTTKLVEKKDQLVPLLVMTVLGKYKGMPGAFISGVFSASLSSLSTGLNSMCAVILEDFIKPACWACNYQLSERAVAIIMRLIIVVFGLITLSLVFVVEKLGPVLQLAISVSGITFGPLIGMFVIGMFMPWLNGRHTITATVVALAAGFYVVLRAQADIASGALTFPMKPTSVAGCTYWYNLSYQVPVKQCPYSYDQVHSIDHSDNKSLHHMSYLYYTAFGFFVTIINANVSCLILGCQNVDKVHPTLITPLARGWFRLKQPQQSDVVIPLNFNQVNCTTQRQISEDVEFTELRKERAEVLLNQIQENSNCLVY